jgi:hypothetical protein
MFATVNAAPESGAFASTKLRFVGRSEVLGHWKMVQIPEETRRKVNIIDPRPQPYRWVAFYDDRLYNSALTLKDGSQMTVAKLEGIFAAGGNNFRFEFLENHRYLCIAQPGGISQYWAIAACDEALDFRVSR